MRASLPLLILSSLLLLPAFATADDDLPDFKNVVLKTNPTRSDVVQYLKDLEKAEDVYLRAIAKRRIPFRLEAVDEVAKKLNEIPSEFIDLILDRAPQTRSFINFPRAYPQSVLTRTDLTPAQAEVISKRLTDFPDLIDLVVRHRWESLMEKSVLKAAKANTSDSRLTLFVKALARLNTPDSNKLLTELLTRGNASIMTDSYNTALPLVPTDLDWPKIVAKAWQIAREDQDRVHYYAPIAARYGSTEALLVMAKKLNAIPNDLDPRSRLNRTAMRRALLQLLDVQYTTEEKLVQHVLDHRDRLVFGPEAGVFIVK